LHGIFLCRRTFDRALAALPITQHDRVWLLYMVGGGGGNWLLGACKMAAVRG
jgi:pre-mRNA-splicing factor SYF1